MQRLLSIGIVSLVLFVPLYGEERRLDLRWAELAGELKGFPVEVVLPDAVFLKGRIRSATVDTLEFDVLETSDKRVHPKGVVSLPRPSVKTLQYAETRGKWRGLGTAIGAGAGGAAGALAAIPINNEGNSSRAAGIVAGAVGAGAALGFFAGRGADRKVTIVRIVD